LIGVEDGIAFEMTPAETNTVDRGSGDDVDLFDLALADVGDPEFVGVRVEEHPPGVAKSDGDNLAGSPAPVFFGHSDHLAQRVDGVQREPLGVASRTAVAVEHPEAAIGPHDLAAVVVRVRLLEKIDAGARGFVE